MKKMTFRASGTRAKNDFKGVVVIEKIKNLRKRGIFVKRLAKKLRKMGIK